MAEDTGTGPETTEVGETADETGVSAPESADWWQFGTRDAAEKWANDLITKRLSRHKKSVVDPIEQERDTLKAEVDRLKPLEDATKTDVQRFEDRLNAVLPELESLRTYKAQQTRSELVRSVAEELGIPAKFVSRIQGNDEDAIRADASDLLNVLSEGGSTPGKKVPPAKAPRESKPDGKPSNGGGGSDDESDDSLISEILGQVNKDRAMGGLTTRR